MVTAPKVEFSFYQAQKPPENLRIRFSKLISVLYTFFKN